MHCRVTLGWPGPWGQGQGSESPCLQWKPLVLGHLGICSGAAQREVTVRVGFSLSKNGGVKRVSPRPKEAVLGPEREMAGDRAGVTRDPLPGVRAVL